MIEAQVEISAKNGWHKQPPGSRLAAGDYPVVRLYAPLDKSPHGPGSHRATAQRRQA